MSIYKAIADDYYINGLNNAQIFEKHGLTRMRSSIGQERVFEHLPNYKHSTLECLHCDGEMESTYLSKGSSLATDRLERDQSGKGLQNIALVRLEGYEGRGRHLRNYGAACQVDGGHKISIPSCVSCGHQLQDRCRCDACVELLSSRATEAAALTLYELTATDPLKVDQLSAFDLLTTFTLLSTFRDKVAQHNLKVAIAALYRKEIAMLVMLGCTSPSASSVLSAVTMVSQREYYIDWDKIEYELVNSGELDRLVVDTKISARSQVKNEVGLINVLGLWESLAEEEAMGVLQHYCDVHDICCTPGELTRAAIKRSLNRYGLAQTARYIYSAVWKARKYSSENGFDRYRAFTFIYGSLNFWIEDPRARSYEARPFIRTEQVLSEPNHVSVFASLFLEPIDVNYFSDAVGLASFENIQREEFL